MEVSILTYTPNASKVLDTAALMTRSNAVPSAIFDNLDTKTSGEVAKRVFNYGHTSIYEHASVTFSISEVSRVLETELVRHRIASYSVRSGNITGKYFSLLLPPAVEEAMNEFSDLADCVEAIENLLLQYKQLAEQYGIPYNQMRYLLPQGSKTAIIATMNLREIAHFFTLRMCKKAQFEIRELAWRMYIALDEIGWGELLVTPFPDCVYSGCKQGKECCGSPYSNDEIEQLLAKYKGGS